MSADNKKMDTKQFIEKAIKKHCDKYDYSLVKYLNSTTKIKIICPIHGEFEQIPSSHIAGRGCRFCSNENNGKRKSIKKDKFIERSKSIHGDKYDYSQVEYINNKTKVKIICPIHGVYDAIPKTHLIGRGCMKCFYDSTRFTQERFIEISKKIHNNKYDYSLVKYINTKTKIKIICPKHGIFEQKALQHLQGQNCFKCYTDIQRSTKDEFINQAVKIHGNKYDYSLTNYINYQTPVDIICPIHGIFTQSVGNHLYGRGCFKCAKSVGEDKISEFLFRNNIEYIFQMKFEGCKNHRLLPFDFYLKEYNTCIEYDGKQHFEPNEFFGGFEGFLKLIENDKIKNEYCKNNNIRLIRIRYDEDVKQILENHFQTRN